MRVRSLLLGVCMVVVPALALFSHHVPPGLAAAVREAVSRQTAAWSGRQEAATVPREPAVAPPADPPTPPPASTAVPSPPQTVAVAPQPIPAGSTVPRRAVEDRLLELGATAIECQPMPGGPGTLVASCRVAVDASGQLQRVFQAAGPDPTGALERLLVDLQAWRQRVAADSRAATR